MEKKSCQTPKKKKKKVDFGVLRTKVVWKLSVRLQKKKKVLDLRIFIVRVIQSTSGIYAVVEPHFWDVYLPPLRLQGLIDFD